MSGIRQKKRNIVKNSYSCYGCKNYILVGHEYGYEEDTNAYYRTGPTHKCMLLNIVSSSETIEDYFYCNGLTEEEFESIERRNDLHRGNKICGLYLYKPKKTGHWTKVEPVRSVNIDFDIDDDDIPF